MLTSFSLYKLKRNLKKILFNKRVKPIAEFKLFKNYFENKSGIEIGGLSQIFKKEIPIYSIVKALDGCNFSTQTVWEGTIMEGMNYNFYKSKIGFQYVCEAADLKKIPSEHYDFLVSSHCLEHCANTIKTLKEWTRVVKKGGVILLILPDKKFTFDHKRPITEFSHLVEDYNRNIDESDLTHLNEIVELHDLEKDPPAGSLSQFKERSLDNFNNRCLHHHVFDFNLLKELFEFCSLEVVNTTLVNPYHQVILGIKK